MWLERAQGLDDGHLHRWAGLTCPFDPSGPVSRTHNTFRAWENAYFQYNSIIIVNIYNIYYSEYIILNPAWVIFIFLPRQSSNIIFIFIFSWRKGHTKAKLPETHEAHSMLLVVRVFVMHPRSRWTRSIFPQVRKYQFFLSFFSRWLPWSTFSDHTTPETITASTCLRKSFQGPDPAKK